MTRLGLTKCLFWMKSRFGPAALASSISLLFPLSEYCQWPVKDFGQVFLHCHALILCITNPGSVWGVGISTNWLHLPLRPGYQLAEVMVFARLPWHRSSTAAICWFPELHFLDKHDLPMGNVTSHLQWIECKWLFQLLWDPQDPAWPLSNVTPLVYNGHNPSSCKKKFPISKESIKNFTFPPKISVFEQNQERNKVLLCCSGFPFGDAEYLITASQGHFCLDSSLSCSGRSWLRNRS